MDIPISTYFTDMQTSFVEDTHTSSSLKEKNFGLHASSFEALLQGLETGNESLFEKVFVSQYRRCCRYLMINYSVGEQDAKDIVMNTLLDFRKLLLARKVTFGNLEAYFTKMVVTGYLKKQKNNQEISVGVMPEDVVDKEVPQYSEAEFTQFAKAWSCLCDKCKTVLKAYYYDDLPHAQIAVLIGKNFASSKQDKHRCIAKLRRLFFDTIALGTVSK